MYIHSWIFLWGYSKIGVSNLKFGQVLKSTFNFTLFMKWALLFIVLIMLTLYVALFISFRKLKENEQRLRDEGR